MAKLSREEVLKLAQLSLISLTDEEVALFQDQLSDILQYVEMLSNVDVNGLKPTNQVTGLTNVTRPDEIINYGYEPRDLLKNVPVVQDGLIKVKRMIG